MRVSSSLASCYTYAFGKSLHVPLTSYSNSCTLPETRGPNFLLPAEVVVALCRVRDAENRTEMWKHWCMYLETQESPQKLPKAQDSIEKLKDVDYVDGSLEDGRFPSVKDLVVEVNNMLKTAEFDEIVFSGEGEPSLRMESLLTLSEEIDGKIPTIRMNTNGLSITEDSIVKLKTSGVKAVSVALMSADSKQYFEIMKPIAFAEEDAHRSVCGFIQRAIKSGLTVEATGVDRQDVNKQQTEELATSLGVTAPFRWRPYFP